MLLLREAHQSPSLIGIEESQLIVAMLAMVAPQVEQNERRSVSTYGTFHLTVLSLAARFFDLHWAEGLDAEDKSICES